MQINTVGSMIPFVNALGEVYLVVYCLKSAENKPVKFHVPTPNESRDVCFSFFIFLLYVFFVYLLILNYRPGVCCRRPTPTASPRPAT